MRITKPAANRRYRTRAGLSLLAAAAVSLGTAGIAQALPAPAAPVSPAGQAQLTVAPSPVTAVGESTVTITGSAYATTTPSGSNFGGAYIFFGVVDPIDPANPDSWGPSYGGSTGVNYMYAGDDYQNMVTYPGHSFPGAPEMDASGNWTFDFTIPGPTFTDTQGTDHDCYVEQCGIITIGAHGQKNVDVEAFGPINFVKQTAPVITTEPVDVTVDEGTDASFSVVASGDPAPTYQWQRSDDQGANWSDIAGATADMYTVSAATAADDGALFRVVVSNSVGAVTSAAAKLTVTTTAVDVLTVTLQAQESAAHPLYFASEDSELDVTISDATVTGTVTIFDEDRNLGQATVVDGKATVPVTFSLYGGARYLHASFQPDDMLTYPDPILSDKQLFQIVDMDPEVSTPDVDMDNPATLNDGEMTWTWGNYYTDFFKSGFTKEAVGDNVKLGELSEDSGLGRTNQEIVFFNGTGVQDKWGTYQVNFTGEAKVLSGYTDFRFVDPEIIIDSEGYGTLTAVFTSGMGEADWQGERRYIATFDEYGTSIADNGDGTVTITADPIWEDQTWEGTWTLEKSASYPADMLAAMDSGIRGFWHESGSSSDPSKKPHPLTLTFKMEQTLKVAEQGTANHPKDYVGQASTLTAMLEPAGGEGTVEFFDNGVSLGTGDVVDGKAMIDVTWTEGGKHDITAKFTPTGESVATLESPASLYRVVDTAWLVDEVDVAADGLALDPSTTSFTWTFGNYYLEFFQSGFTKEAIGDHVTLYPADTAAGVDNPPIGSMSDDTNAEFQFTNGTGTKDAAGNVAIDFIGTARVKSGDMLFWDFKDPQVRIAADGHGYVTAEFTDTWADPDRQGVRVLVGEFTTSEGPNVVTAGVSPKAAGETWRHYMKPMYEAHTAVGTWAADFTSGYPNEMLANISDDGRAFWHETGSSSDIYKPPHQMMLQYADVEPAPEPEPEPEPEPTDPVEPPAPEPTDPVEPPAPEPTDPVEPPAPEPTDPVEPPAPTTPPAPHPTTPPAPQPKLPITGAETASLALLMAGLSGAGFLVIRRKYAR